MDDVLIAKIGAVLAVIALALALLSIFQPDDTQTEKCQVKLEKCLASEYLSATELTHRVKSELCPVGTHR